jgi:hypothetical protein
MSEFQIPNPTAHLNRAKVKQTALEVVKQLRPFWNVENIGMSFLLRIEGATRAAIVSEVKRHPTKGKTLL